MQHGPDELGEFVAISDRFGGPGSPQCIAYWSTFSYQPRYQVDQDIDPFSESYVAEQVALYEELSGRRYNVQKNELTSFDVERHVTAPNPYDHPDPTVLASHLQRLARALRFAAPRRGDTLLDLGCGWGLSSELAAYLGLEVIAVDVNPAFIRLVRERALAGRRTILAKVSTFEDFTVSTPVDIALFYECLHHAVRPWVVASRVAGGLRQGGRMVLAGEPISRNWWRHWGMRLDAFSVYCIRKFGWFESGWSIEFIQRVLSRAGLTPRVHASEDSDIGYVIVAEKRAAEGLSGNAVGSSFDCFGTIIDGDYLILTGAGFLTVSFASDSPTARLRFQNCRSEGLRVRFICGDVVVFQGEVAPGRMEIMIAADDRSSCTLSFNVERWVPDEETSNGDQRVIGLHLESLYFLTGDRPDSECPSSIRTA